MKYKGIKGLLLGLCVAGSLILSGCDGGSNNQDNKSLASKNVVEKHDPYANATQFGATKNKIKLEKLKDTTNLSKNGHEGGNGLLQSELNLSSSPATGLHSPSLLADGSGSNISGCLYNNSNHYMYVKSTTDNLEKHVFGEVFKVLPDSYVCADQLVFNSSESTTKFDVFLEDPKLKPEALSKASFVLKIEEISGQSAIAIVRKTEGISWQTVAFGDTSDDWKISSDNEIHSVGFGDFDYWLVKDGSINTVVHGYTENVPGWLVGIVYAVIAICCIIGIFIGVAVWSLMLLFLLALGLPIAGYFAMDALFISPYTEAKTVMMSNLKVPDYRNDYERDSSFSRFNIIYDEIGNQIGYEDEATEKSNFLLSLQDASLIEASKMTKVHSSEIAKHYNYVAASTNVIQLCFTGDDRNISSCPVDYIKDIITTSNNKLSPTKPAAMVYGSFDASNYLSLEDLNKALSDYKLDKEAYNKFTNSGGPKGNWTSGNTSFNKDSWTIVDKGNPQSGAIAEVFNYAYCKLGSEVNYVSMKPNTVQNVIIPIGAYRTLCKDVNYDAHSGAIYAQCPSNVSSNGNVKGSPVLQTAVGLVGDCKQVNLVNGKFECAKNTGDLSDFPMQATAASQCNVVEAKGQYTFTCADPDTLQLKKLPAINKSNLLNQKDFAYDAQSNKIKATTTLIASPKMLACDEYSINAESSIRPGEKMLATYGANFVSDKFDPVYGDYSYTYKDKANILHTLNLNVYSKCMNRLLTTELGLDANSKLEAPNLELHCLVGKSGPELYSSVVKPKDGDDLYLVINGSIVLKSDYALVESAVTMLNYVRYCNIGSGIALEDLKNKITGDVNRVFTCKSYKDAKIDANKGPVGTYQSSCTNIFYQNNTGYLQAFCKANNGTYKASRLNTRFAINANIVNDDGVLKIK